MRFSVLCLVLAACSPPPPPFSHAALGGVPGGGFIPPTKAGAGGGTGTVSDIATSAPLSGGPITGAGTLSLSYGSGLALSGSDLVVDTSLIATIADEFLGSACGSGWVTNYQSGSAMCSTPTAAQVGAAPLSGTPANDDVLCWFGSGIGPCNATDDLTTFTVLDALVANTTFTANDSIISTGAGVTLSAGSCSSHACTKTMGWVSVSNPSGTSVTVTFTSHYTQAPVCNATYKGATVTPMEVVSTSTSTLVVKFGTPGDSSGGGFMYTCIGAGG